MTDLEIEDAIREAWTILYAGSAPGLINGTIQINARVPATVSPGAAAPVILQVGGAMSRAGITIAVD